MNQFPESLISSGNEIHTGTVNVANKLNEHFVKKGPKLASKLSSSNVSYRKFLSRRNPHSMIFSEILIQEVIQVISELLTNKASGHDSISAQILQWCMPYISNFLTIIFNKCVERGVYPSTLKLAKVTALHKSGEKYNADNYHPISILPQINKVFEKLIHKRLVSFLTKYKIISKQLFAFRKNIQFLIVLLACVRSLFEIWKMVKIVQYFLLI